MRFHDYPVPLPEAMIEMIRKRLATDTRRVPYLQPGERVRIAEGPFSDFEAIFVANDGQERVVLLMNILSREQQTIFPAGTVRRSLSAVP